jgi:hypothetical protein
VRRLEQEYARLEAENNAIQEKKRIALLGWEKINREAQVAAFRVELAEGGASEADAMDLSA